MDIVTLAIIVGGLLAYSLISGRLRGTVVTAPLMFIIYGFAVGSDGFGLAQVDVGHGGIHFIAEMTLVLVLFTDAARIDLKRVRSDHNLPGRMLIIGLPLTMVAGTLVALLLFPAFSVWEAALLAALLAPTDAALGQSVVTDKIVPVRIRQAINIESGLNDGIALPAVLFFATLAGTSHAAAEADNWIQFALLQVTLGPVLGILIGFVGARALDSSIEKGWTSNDFQGIGVLSLAVFCYVVAEFSGGNGFIATFVGGMVFGNTIRHPCTFLFEFMETEGQLLMLITFFIFGAVLLGEGIAHVDGTIILYSVLSLTVIRMLPIAISLLGEKVSAATQLFLGWFGPRGLASILFVLLILEQAQMPNRETILSVVVVTVALSALLHGISAAPLSQAYGRKASAMGECEENLTTSELPLRHG